MVLMASTPITLSPEQSAALGFVCTGRGNAIIEAVAGSGKTFTLVEMLKLLQGYAADDAFAMDAIDQAEVYMGVDQTGGQPLPGEIFDLGAGGRGAAARGVDGENPARLDENRRIGDGRGAGAVDHGGVDQRRGFLRRLGSDPGNEKEGRYEESHIPSSVARTVYSAASTSL